MKTKCECSGLLGHDFEEYMALNPDWGNTTENITKVVVPQGTMIYEGIAAPQNIYDSPGNTIGILHGGNQIYIPRVEAEWFK